MDYILFIMSEVRVFKGFGCFREATKKQKIFAGKLGFNLKGVPQNVAKAIVEYLVHTEFYGKKIRSIASFRRKNDERKRKIEF